MTEFAFPHMYRIRQHLADQALPDPVAELRRLLAAHPAVQAVRPGMSVAVTAGSRGIANIPALLAAVVDELKQRGAEPFLVPAMGSHGGATAEGQVNMLASLGITEQSVGAPIRSSMDVVELGRTPDGLPVYCDRNASQADMIAVVGRVKPHTSFRAEIESGLLKMLAIGLGKQRGAETMHHGKGAFHSIPAVARVTLAKAPIGFGVALVEDAFDHTAIIRVLAPEEFEPVEKELLVQAKQMMPHLPFDQLDVLIVDEIGKHISGTGMDPNVIGMGRRTGGESHPEIDKIVVLDLHEASHGNANGIGMADLTTRRLVNKIDLPATYMNSMTADCLLTSKIPMTMETDRKAVEIAMRGYSAADVRMVRIKNTLLLEEMDVSAALLDELRGRSDVTVIEDKGILAFGPDDNLV